MKRRRSLQPIVYTYFTSPTYLQYLNSCATGFQDCGCSQTLCSWKSDQELSLIKLDAEIDAVLTLNQHAIKRGIEVERDFSSDTPVFVDVDKLNQVWQNLISNAIQAMKGKGTLRVQDKT